MAVDEALAARVRTLLIDRRAMREQRMFGGVVFMDRGNMVVGVMADGLLVRAGAAQADELLGEPGVSLMRMGERTMRGWLRVDASVAADDGQLRAWLDRCLVVTDALPPKG